MSLLVFVFSYLLGAVPFGLVLARTAGLGDIRKIGSGNIGATNVLRTGRKDLALATLVLDSSKGAIAVLVVMIATAGNEGLMAIAAAAAFLGHCFPVYLLFKGGKGVATFLGTILALGFTVGLIACGIWAATAAITRYSSLSALVAAAITPFLFLVNGQWVYFAAALFMAGLIFLRHKANILRLLDRTEPRIGAGGKSDSPKQADSWEAPAISASSKSPDQHAKAKDQTDTPQDDPKN